jgi:hypothetical protein
MVKFFCLVLVITTYSLGWYTAGHEKATVIALAALKGKVPDFIVAGKNCTASFSVDPDLFKDSTAPQLKSTEGPEHFYDVEKMGNRPLSKDRRTFMGLCSSIGVDSWSVGFLPYAIIEWNQRLTIAFAEYRAWPQDSAIRMKCMVYCGIMAHYAGDLTQPLHVTVHYNGKKLADGTMLYNGIHGPVDGLLTTVADSVLPMAMIPHGYPSLLDSVAANIKLSFGLVDTVYKLGMPDSGSAWRAFAVNRVNVTALTIADFVLTAWEKSALIKIPEWDTH